MREQGSLKGVGTHRENLCVDAQIIPNPDMSFVIYLRDSVMFCNMED